MALFGAVPCNAVLNDPRTSMGIRFFNDSRSSGCSNVDIEGGNIACVQILGRDNGFEQWGRNCRTICGMHSPWMSLGDWGKSGGRGRAGELVESLYFRLPT